MNYRQNNKNLTRQEVKAQKRAEAESRNEAYQKLSLEEKISRQVEGGKVHKKLTNS